MHITGSDMCRFSEHKTYAGIVSKKKYMSRLISKDGVVLLSLRVLFRKENNVPFWLQVYMHAYMNVIRLGPFIDAFEPLFSQNKMILHEQCKQLL